MKDEKLLTTQELIENYNKYYKQTQKLKKKLKTIKDQMQKDIEVFKNGEYDKRDFIIDLRDYIRYIESDAL